MVKRSPFVTCVCRKLWRKLPKTIKSALSPNLRVSHTMESVSAVRQLRHSAFATTVLAYSSHQVIPLLPTRRHGLYAFCGQCGWHTEATSRFAY